MRAYSGRFAFAVLLSSVLGVTVGACGSADLVVGDDSRDASSVDTSPVLDAAPAKPDSARDAAVDAAVDAPPGTCAAAPGGPGSCLAPGTACRKKDTTGLTCPNAGTFCCVEVCPDLVQPAPTFCGGKPYAPVYDSKGCIIGFACTPVMCAAAGGSCVGLAPGSCPSNHFGDATKYSCGPGVGTGCCLP